MITHRPDGWMQFGEGQRWRCVGPRALCEVALEGNTPNYLRMASTVAHLRRVKSFYSGRVSFGVLDQMGTGLDILVANAMTESFGTVPSPLSKKELLDVYHRATGTDPGVKLDQVIRHIALRAKYLERREPGYVDPIRTEHRVSVGAHHVLISTARSLRPTPARKGTEAATAEIVDLVCRLPAESLAAAEFAVAYFNRAYSKHQNQPPLLAATYNAGSPRPDPSNVWNLKQYGQHIDRWVAYYNTSRMI